MGMQCHFNLLDLPDFSKTIFYDYESDIYTYTQDGFTFDCSKAGNAWFDIGQLSDSGKAKLFWLIQNRVCFNCS